LFIYLTPLIPLSFKGEGEVWVLKGLRPFRLPLINNLLTRLARSYCPLNWGGLFFRKAVMPSVLSAVVWSKK
jgi:hypothetical protein